METGKIDEAKLSADMAAALKDALRGTPLEAQVTIINHTSDPSIRVQSARASGDGRL